MRWFRSGDYRYGFNRQEKSNEVNGDGNSYTAEFWQYDSRIGRRWNIDPEPVIGIGEYATFSNNPILYSDVLGNSPKPPGFFDWLRLFSSITVRAADVNFSQNAAHIKGKATDFAYTAANNLTHVELKSPAQLRQTGLNLWGGLWGGVNGIVKYASLGMYSRSAEDVGIRGEAADRYRQAESVTQYLGLVEGIGPGPSVSPKLSIAGESRVAAANMNIGIHLKPSSIVYSTSASGGQDQNSASNETNTEAAQSVPNGKFYSVAFEMTLKGTSYPGVSRYLHFKEANEALDVAMASNPLLDRMGVVVPKAASGSIIGQAPTGWVWHHSVERGVMQLVPKSQHPNIP